MQSTLLCFGVGVVLFSLAPPTLSFSRGAGRASCQQMTPGHIRAQPLDPKQSHVTLRASASSYLPGQLVTVTVRSSRDFMGFLLQARSVDGAGVGAGGGPTGPGPVLVGGSWTLTPPGTHTLRCLSEDDTLTHSDKQLKRNLSFVWRAPDAAMGDVRFYITVVQSYFVYWAGIQSAVVRDGSRGPQSGRNITGADRGNSVFVTAVSALTARTATPPGPSATTSSGSQSYRPQKTSTEVAHPVLNSATWAFRGDDHGKNQTVDKRSSLRPSGSLRSESDTDAAFLSGLKLTESPVTDSKHLQSFFSSDQLPFTASFSPAEAKGTKAAGAQNVTEQNSASPLFLVSLPPLKDGEMERKQAKINSQDPKMSIVLETKDTTLNPEATTTAKLPTSNSSHNTRPTSQKPAVSNQDQSSSVKSQTQSSSSQPWRAGQMNLIKFHSKTSSYKPLLQPQTFTSQTFPFSQPSSSTKYQTTSPNLIFPSQSPTVQLLLNNLVNLSSPDQPMISLSKLQPEISPSEPQKTPRQTDAPQPQPQTAAPLSSPPQPQPTNSFHQALFHTIPGQVRPLQIDQSQSDTPPKATLQPGSHPHSITGNPQTYTFGWKQTQTSVTPNSVGPLGFVSRSHPTLTLAGTEQVKDLQSQVKTETLSPVFVPVLPATSSLSSTHTLASSSFVWPGSTTPLYHTESFSSLPSSSMRNQPKTAPALSALPSPSPVSIPPHFPSVQPSSLPLIPSSLTSSTVASRHPSLAPFFSSIPLSTSSSHPFSSPQSVTRSTFSSLSSSTISPAPSSSSIASSTSSISSLPSLHRSPSPTSAATSTPSSYSLSSSSPTNLSAASSSLVSSQSTSPHPEPSPAPRRSLDHPLTSTSSPLPSQEFTRGQRLRIQNHISSTDPESNLNLPTPKTVVHPNPEPHPNLDPNFNQNLDRKLKPNLPNSDTRPKHPSSPSGTPDKEGKYPDLIPRHSAWELGMLLGCSAGLGMILVVGLRYVYHQACGKRTEVTLNDRASEYGRGERGLIHVQECGDLVRVRRIRENSFVLLAEYDILTTPGD